MKPSDLPEHGFQIDAGKLRDARSRADAEETPVNAERSTALFGAIVETRRPFPVAAFLCAIVAAACAGLGYLHLAWLLWGTIGFGTVALALFLGSRTRMAYHFTEEGIIFGSSQSNLLPYHEILEVYVHPHERGHRDFAIVLLTADGFETIPAKLTISSDAVYEFLLTQPLGTRDVGEVPALFANFLRQQRALYPAKDIYVYRARGKPKRRQRHWHFAVVFGLGLLLAGLTWLVVSFVAGASWVGPLLATGICAMLLGALIFGIGLFTKDPTTFTLQSSVTFQRIKNRADSLLILSPGGIALSVGDLKGELRWQELVGLHHKAAGKQITFNVAGASIEVFDLFHWPIDHIAVLCQLYYDNAKKA